MSKGSRSSCVTIGSVTIGLRHPGRRRRRRPSSGSHFHPRPTSSIPRPCYQCRRRTGTPKAPENRCDAEIASPTYAVVAWVPSPRLVASRCGFSVSAQKVRTLSNSEHFPHLPNIDAPQFAIVHLVTGNEGNGGDGK